ncbi:hypothetical protein BB561_003591 [Smittium simulii]|uniref:Ubiquinol-cytochrome C reductase hinge domain-containing protein n=1 Tax=Smittium simulii TaxID=133385 RepID=A0A2T9YKG2_9FUNG|nr:hypothetical protein BB561_003591 [Smittium simulii]
MGFYDSISSLSTYFTTVHAEELEVIDIVIVPEEEQYLNAHEIYNCFILNPHNSSHSIISAFVLTGGCTKRTEEGSTESCAEEFYHFVHCIDHCAAEKVYAKLA